MITPTGVPTPMAQYDVSIAIPGQRGQTPFHLGTASDSVIQGNNFLNLQGFRALTGRDILRRHSTDGTRPLRQSDQSSTSGGSARLMPFYFKRTLQLIRGVNVNLSLHRVGLSIGAHGLRAGVGPAD
jgi:hypothetical protein